MMCQGLSGDCAKTVMASVVGEGRAVLEEVLVIPLLRSCVAHINLIFP